jgi:hypothetical protein
MSSRQCEGSLKKTTADAGSRSGDHLRMTNNDVENWYLQEWFAHLGKRQSSLVNELGWDKARASFVWTGRQPYKRALVNEIATWLGLRPYELLMHPRDALALRRLRETAAAIVAEEAAPPFEGPKITTPARRRAAR